MSESFNKMKRNTSLIWLSEPLTHMKVPTHLQKYSIFMFNDIYFGRITFPVSTDPTMRVAIATQNHQLWTSVSTALCGCVNNPQNGNVSFAFVLCTVQLVLMLFSFWLLFSHYRILYSVLMCMLGVWSKTKTHFFNCLSFVFQRRVNVFVFQPFQL